MINNCNARSLSAEVFPYFQDQDRTSGNHYNFACILNSVANGRDKDGTVGEHFGEEMAADDLRKTPTESKNIINSSFT